MTKQVPSWLPDWQDEDQYPDSQKTTPQEWAWEYLRRNTDYQTMYHKFIALLDDVIFNNDDIIDLLINNGCNNHCVSFLFLTTNPIGRKFLDLTPEVLNFRQQVQRTFMVRSPMGMAHPALSYNEAKPHFITTRSAAYSPKVNLMLSVDDNMKDAIFQRSDIFFDETVSRQIDLKEEHMVNIMKKPTEILFSVDLAFNYEDQIKRIKKILQREKKSLAKLGHGKRITKKAEHKLGEMLIAYDAKLQGVPNKVIAKYLLSSRLCPNPAEANSRVSKYIRRAKELIKGDYIRLASTH